MKKSLFLLALTFFVGSLFAQNWQTIQSDDFNRTDGSLGENYVINTYPETAFVQIVDNNVRLGPEDSDLYASIKSPMVETGMPFKISLDFKCRSATDAAYCGYGVVATTENNNSIGALVFLDKDTIEIAYMDQYNQMTTILSTEIDINDTLWYTVELIINTDQVEMNFLDADGVNLYTLTESYQDTLAFNRIGINTYQSTGEIIHFDNLLLQNQGVDIEGFELSQIVNIYPNPSSDFINLEGIQQKANVEIYSIVGQKMSEEIIESASQDIDISGLNSGVYVLKLTTKKGKLFRKFIKE